MESPPKQSKSHGNSSQLSASAPQNKTSSSTRGGTSGAPAGGEFIVARILGKRITKNESQYHVKWEGYSMAEATWEPFSNLQYNVVRTRFDDKLEKWVKKHDDAGTGHRVSDVDREIAEWTSKQPGQKLKFAKNNEELRADRVDLEWREFANAGKSQSQSQNRQSSSQQNPPLEAAAVDSAGAATSRNTNDPPISSSYNTPGKPAAAAGTTGINNISLAPTPTPTGIATPGGVASAGGGGPIVSGAAAAAKGGSSMRRKRTSPYPEWVAVARKRLLAEKRNVLKIYSLSSINDVPCYKVQLDGLREPEYIPTVLVKSHHPNRVIEFYEDHLTVPSPSKNGKRIKLKDLFAEMQQQQQLQQQQQNAGGAATQSPFSTSTTATNQSTNNELAAYGEDGAINVPGTSTSESNKSAGNNGLAVPHNNGNSSSTASTAPASSALSKMEAASFDEKYEK